MQLSDSLAPLPFTAARPSPAATATQAEPAGGHRAISDGLRQACQRMSDAAVQYPPSNLKHRSLLGTARHADIGNALRTAFPRTRVSRSVPDPMALGATLSRHTGPVIVVDAFGRPEQVFEHADGQWHAYDAMLNPLGTAQDPRDMMSERLRSSPPGTVFCMYDIDSHLVLEQQHRRHGDAA